MLQLSKQYKLQFLIYFIVGGRAFSYQAPLLWNQLPVQVREADTLSMFKSSGQLALVYANVLDGKVVDFVSFYL